MKLPRTVMSFLLGCNPAGLVHAFNWGPVLILEFVIVTYVNFIIAFYGSQWERESTVVRILCAPNRIVERLLPEESREWWKRNAAGSRKTRFSHSPAGPLDKSYIAVLVAANIALTVFIGWLCFGPIKKMLFRVTAAYVAFLRSSFCELYGPFRQRFRPD